VGFINGAYSYFLSLSLSLSFFPLPPPQLVETSTVIALPDFQD
jgi:hypothetical protein